MHHTKTILLASLLLFPLSSLAQTEVPNAFSDGTPALAAEVNENFTAVADGVNAQDVRIQNVESAIAGPQKMVFLGYAEGAQIGNFYAGNQICKDAYSNPAARMVTTDAWMTFVREGQMPLPTDAAIIWGPNDAIAYSDTITELYSPSLNQRVINKNVSITVTGDLGVSVDGATLTACMAPAG
jgi:hypothetical protein